MNSKMYLPCDANLPPAIRAQPKPLDLETFKYLWFKRNWSWLRLQNPRHFEADLAERLEREYLLEHPELDMLDEYMKEHNILPHIEGKTIDCSNPATFEELRDCYDGPFYKGQSMTPENLNKLRQVRNIIAERPNQFDWDHYFDLDTPNDTVGNALERCGTVACVAGWVLLFNTDKSKVVESLAPYPGYDVIAANILGITDDNLVKFLFFPWNWYDKEGRRISMHEKNKEVLAREAVRRIDWLLEGKDYEDYVITDPDILKTNDYEEV